jgi:predicted ATPase/DNA-binding winged helix-turn-helix (wHTH) protein
MFVQTLMPDSDSVSFGPFRLFPRERRLEKGGVPVRLGDRALDVLLVLIEQPGTVVSKAALMARVWPGLTVDESTLRVHMAGLRQVLGKSEAGADYLTNVSGRGYAFVSDVSGTSLGTTNQAAANGAGDLGAEPPPGCPSNLPHGLTPLIGRSNELAELQKLMQTDRMVTLAGMGGIGKTRLAVELGRQLQPEFPGGVWLVDFAPLSNPALVSTAVGATIGAPVRDLETAADALADALAKHPTLLIFDNCEHLIDAIAALTEGLLTRAPNLAVVATSRETMRIAGEQVFHIKALAVPPSGEMGIASFGAVALFVARCQTVEHGFRLSEANANGVAEICRRLEGVPLALEMAAARLPMFGVKGLLERLAAPLHLLKSSKSQGDPRHSSLRAMLEWSHGLLDDTEARVFRRLASFAGSFSLQAAVAVAHAAGEDEWDTMDALGRLIDKSLVIVEPVEPPRYRLLDTLRVFAIEKLNASGEAAANAERHANFFSRLIESVEETHDIPQKAELRTRYLVERDNIHAALDWAFADPSRRQRAIAMTGAAIPILYYKSFYQARRYVDQALLLEDEATSTNDLARLLTHAGTLWSTSDRPRALSLSKRAAELYRRTDSTFLYESLRQIGLISTYLGEFEEANAALMEARAILIRINRSGPLILVESSLGNVARNLGDIERAKRHYEAAMELARANKDSNYELFLLLILAELEFQIGNFDRAIEMGTAVVDGVRRDPQGTFLSSALANLAAYLLAQADAGAARSYAQEFFALSKQVGGFEFRVSIMLWALIAALEGHFTDAALLAGFVDDRFERGGEVKEPTEKRTDDHLKALLTAALPAAKLQALTVEGASWTDQEAAAFVERRLLHLQDSAE